MLRQFDLARDRRVSIEGEMCSVLVIISEVRMEDPLKMPLVEHDDVPKALASDRADGPRFVARPSGHGREIQRNHGHSRVN